MAAKYIYDYVQIKVPDNDVRLTVASQDIIVEEYFLNQEIHLFDDGTEEVITFDTNGIVNVDLLFPHKTEADTGTILDDYLNASTGYGRNEQKSRVGRDGPESGS